MAKLYTIAHFLSIARGGFLGICLFLERLARICAIPRPERQNDLKNSSAHTPQTYSA